MLVRDRAKVVSGYCRILFLLLIFSRCSNNSALDASDSGTTSDNSRATGDAKSRDVFTGKDSGATDDSRAGDAESRDVFASNDSGATDDSRANEIRLNIDNVIKYLFEADVTENSLSVYFEPREQYPGENFVLNCYDSNKTLSLQVRAAARAETSIDNRYLFYVLSPSEGVDYNCGLSYQDDPVLFQGSDRYIRVRLKNRNFPTKYLLIADVHSCDSFDKFIPFLEEESDSSAALISVGDHFVADGLTGADDYRQMWYRFFGVLGDLLYENPFYPVLGNHDVGNITDPVSVGHGAFLGVFELPKTDRIEHSYYAINGNNHTLIVLDSTSLTIDDAQIDLINRATTDSADTHPILLLHHQIQGVENSPTQGGPAIMHPAPNDFHEYIRSRGIRLVINAHRHFYHVYKKDETFYITMPTICEHDLLPNNTRVFDDKSGTTMIYNDAFYGYGVLEIYEDKMRFTVKGYSTGGKNITEMETIEIAE